jgi:hypothetical protein
MLKMSTMPFYQLRRFHYYQGWRVQLWKWKVHLKVILFFCLVVQNMILTWDTLQLKGWAGPSLCTLCKQNVEGIPHLFIDCTFTKSVWAKCEFITNTKYNWGGRSLTDCMNSWTTNKHFSKRLSVLMCWYIWKERNKSLFEDRPPSAWAVMYKVIGELKQK